MSLNSHKQTPEMRLGNGVEVEGKAACLDGEEILL